jgi:hypothetical protein
MMAQLYALTEQALQAANATHVTELNGREL